MGCERPVAELKRWELTVPAGSCGRVDQFLAAHFGVSRRALRHALVAARLTINGRLAKKGSMVRAGDVVIIEHVAALGGERLEARLSMPILYEDAEVVAVNKPCGTPSVAFPWSQVPTVAGYLLGAYPEMALLPRGHLEAGLVHRLDTGTSGVLVAARTPAAYATLRAAFRAGSVGKRYLAIVRGDLLRGGSLSVPLVRSGPRGRQVVPWRPGLKERPQPAITYLRPVRRLGGMTLLAIKIVTGVRHQIRAHLAALGYPVVGDRLYGDRSEGAAQTTALMLHCHKLSFPHPTERKPLLLHAPIPPSWHALLRTSSS